MLQDEETMPEPLLQRIWKTYKISLVLVSVSLILIVFSGVLLVKSMSSTTPITFESESASPSAEAEGKISVDIEGAVNRPGVYELNKAVRVEEAIVAAGGLSEEADSETISKTLNRAATLVDGAKIFIPKIGDSSVSPDNIVRRESGSIVLGSNLLNINTASETELDSLPGIGPVTAGKIVAGRPYQTLEDLVAKKAIGQSLFEKLKNQLTL